MEISKSAIIHDTAQLGKNVSIAPFSVIGPNTKIGDGTNIAAHVNIEGNTVIGKNCQIFQGASIGGEPQILGFDKDISSSVQIGDNTTVREFVTIHRSSNENGKTLIGDNCMFMAYSHVAHDCQVGNFVVVVNYTGLSGHIIVDDFAFISGMVGLHQFIRIGQSAMVGGMSGVNQDVLPFSTVSGAPARLLSINSVGMRRRNIKANVRLAIKSAFKIIKESGLNNSQVIEKIESEIEMCDEIRYLIDFMKNSERGFIGK